MKNDINLNFSYDDVILLTRKKKDGFVIEAIKGKITKTIVIDGDPVDVKIYTSIKSDDDFHDDD